MVTEKIRDSSLSVKIDGLEAVVKTFRKAGPETNKLLQYANKIFAEEVAEKARAKMYPTVRSVSPLPSEGPRGPRKSGKGSLGRTKASIRANATAKGASIVAGGPKAEGFFGHEFGGQGRPTTHMFPRHRGRDGYFLYPTIRAEYKGLAKRWEEILDEVFEEIPS